MIASFPLFIDHGQVLIHAASQPAPGLIWTDAHMAQGFAWNDDVASFAVPDQDGECLVEVEAGPRAEVAAEALWAVQVPFTVRGPVSIGSVFMGEVVAVPDGGCNLVFAAHPGGDGYAFRLRLTFSPSAQGSFRILRRDGEVVTADRVLRDTAEPAV